MYGRTVVKLQGPDDPMIELSSSQPITGDTISARTTTLRAVVTGGLGGELRFVHDGQPLALEGTTQGLGDDFAGSELCAKGKGAPDKVFALTMVKKGVFRAKLKPKGGATGLVYAAESCGEGSTLGCNRAAAGATATFVRDVVAGEELSLVIDGEDKAGFAFDLELSLGAP